jgi:hypothetical protein
VIETLDAAARAGLIVGGDPPLRSLRFAHALVANALYADIGPSRRARLHGLAARALQKSADELPPAVVVQIARHCALAGWAAEAQHWATRAGDDALEHLAPAEAAEHFRAALDLATALGRPDDEQAGLMVRLGDAQHRAGAAVAFDTLETGARLAHRSGATDTLVRAVFAADRGFMLLDQRAPGYLAMVEAALAVTDRADVPEYARLQALLARSLMYTPDAARRLAAAHDAVDLALAHDDPTLLARIGPAVVNGSWGPGHRELRTRVTEQAVRAAETTGDPALECAAYHSAYNVAVEYGDAPSAARLSAISRPTPRAAPVTNAVLPLSPKSMIAPQIFSRARAASIRRNKRSGVTGSSLISMPSRDSASLIAFATAAGEPMVPPSPMPRKPPSVVGDSDSRCTTCIGGISHAVGTR